MNVDDSGPIPMADWLAQGEPRATPPGQPQTDPFGKPNDLHNSQDVSLLYDACHRRGFEPLFTFEEPNPGLFKARVRFGDWDTGEVGPYHSKKVAKAWACKKGYDMLQGKKVEIAASEVSIVTNAQEENWVSILNEHQQAFGRLPPVYHEYCLHGGFAAEVRVPHTTPTDLSFTGKTKEWPVSSKKAAKAAAAKEAVSWLRESSRKRRSEEIEDYNITYAEKDGALSIQNGGEETTTNWIGLLMEHQQAHHRPLPVFEDIRLPPHFASRVTVALTADPNGARYTSNQTPKFSTKKEAKTAAAREAAQWLRGVQGQATDIKQRKKIARLGIQTSSSDRSISGGTDPLPAQTIDELIKHYKPTPATQAEGSQSPLSPANSPGPHLGDNVAASITALVPHVPIKQDTQSTSSHDTVHDALSNAGGDEISTPLNREPSQTVESQAALAASLATSLSLSPPTYNITLVPLPSGITPPSSHSFYNGSAIFAAHPSLLAHIPPSIDIYSAFVPRKTSTDKILVAEVSNVFGKKNAKEALARGVVAFLQEVKDGQKKNDERRVREFREAFAARRNKADGVQQN